MSTDPFDYDIWAEDPSSDGTIDICVREKSDAVNHPWRIEVVASLSVEEARELMNELEDKIRFLERAA